MVPSFCNLRAGVAQYPQDGVDLYRAATAVLDQMLAGLRTRRTTGSRRKRLCVSEHGAVFEQGRNDKTNESSLSIVGQ